MDEDLRSGDDVLGAAFLPLREAWAHSGQADGGPAEVYTLPVVPFGGGRGGGTITVEVVCRPLGTFSFASLLLPDSFPALSLPQSRTMRGLATASWAGR